ncbi:MAG: hypothetical protein ACI9QC_000325 [Oceanicoccus sp.]|jgi:hypothetical protein
MNAMKSTPNQSLERIYSVMESTLHELIDGMQLQDPDEIFNSVILQAYDHIEETNLATDMKAWLQVLIDKTVQGLEPEGAFPIDTLSPSPEEELTCAGFRKNFEEAIDKALESNPILDRYDYYRVRCNQLEWKALKDLKEMGYTGLGMWLITNEVEKGMDWREFVKQGTSPYLSEFEFKNPNTPTEQVKKFLQFRLDIRREHKKMNDLSRLGHEGSTEELFNVNRGIKDLKTLMETGYGMNSHAMARVLSFMDMDDDLYSGADDSKMF